MAARRDRVFVLGGSGFIGGRLIASLLSEGIPVTGLTRRPDFMKGRIPDVSWMAGGLSDLSGAPHRLRDCACVVHCAANAQGERERVHVAGTEKLLDAALRAGTPRFVYLSSIVVYAAPAEGDVDERWPYGRPPDAYGKAKVEAEQEVRSRRGALETIVLQPANVYGPGGWWGGGLPSLMRRGCVIMVDGGGGTANLVHVEDVVQAITLALSVPGIGGERFVITDGQPVAWRRDFEGVERRIGQRATIPMTVAEAKRYSRERLTATLLRRTAVALSRRLRGERPVFPMEDHTIEMFASRAVFSSRRAFDLLGFRPHRNLEDWLATVES